jgi:hypothetical protein
MTVVGVIDAESQSTLEEYLDRKKAQFIRFSGHEVAKAEIQNLRTDLSRLGSRIDSFLTDPSETEDSHLVLGKVQSGKTAHMLGVVASLVDTTCSLVVLVSGVTGQLNRQTRKRLESDLQTLPSMAVNVLNVPTITQVNREDSSFVQEVTKLVERRISSSERQNRRSANLPVLAMLENVPRVDALRVVLNDLRVKFGNKLQVVIIDDEADQASPNAQAKSGDESSIYALLREIRQSGLRNCLLSYTATPQAVLLAVKTGALKPRHCCVISGGQQYFGIEDVCRENSNQRLVKLTDVPTATQKNYPPSLRDAFLDFLIIACIRRQAPELFFSCDDKIQRTGFSGIPESQSMQMLIHPSGKQHDHTKYYRWIKEIVDDVERELGHNVEDPNPAFLSKELEPSYHRVLLRSDVPREVLPLELRKDWVEDITATLLGSSGIVVVNSDTDKPTAGDSMPVDDAGWSTKRQWILIGGDILGRGVTIPNLVSTYFLRSPQTTNFDTLSQQMRFCGYRSRYSKFVYIYAPTTIVTRFKEADLVDRIIFKYATKWDKNNVDLVRNPPQIMHAQKSATNFRPTRPGVLDRGINAKQLNDVPFAAANILVPSVTTVNASRVIKIAEKLELGFETPNSKWSVYKDISSDVFEELLAWGCIGEKDKAQLEATHTVFDEELQEAGLFETRKVVAMRGFELISLLSKHSPADQVFDSAMIDSTSYRSLRIPSRSLIPSNPELALSQWINTYSNQSDEIEKWMTRAEVQYEGDPQRRLRDRDVTPQVGACTIFVIEPVYVFSAPKRDGGSVIGVGIEFAILAPKDFSLTSWTVPQ